MRQGSNGSSQNEKLCNSCTNSTWSYSQQQARHLKSSLGDNPKRPHSMWPLFFSSSLKKINHSQFLEKLARSFMSHYLGLGYDTPLSFPYISCQTFTHSCPILIFLPVISDRVVLDRSSKVSSHHVCALILVIIPSCCRQRGEHDAENQMVFERNLGFFFHDSCEFEAGRDWELKLVKQFIKQHTKAGKLQCGEATSPGVLVLAFAEQISP